FVPRTVNGNRFATLHHSVTVPSHFGGRRFGRRQVAGRRNPGSVTKRSANRRRTQHRHFYAGSSQLLHKSLRKREHIMFGGEINTHQWARHKTSYRCHV